MRRHLKRVGRSRVAATVVFAAAIASSGLLGVATASGPAGATQQHATPSCTTAGLDVWINTSGVGSAGQMTYKVEFTNVSAHACTMFGYPGVSGIDRAGHQLGSAAARDAATTPSITLASAAHASGLSASSDANTAIAFVAMTDTGALSPSGCAHVTAEGLRVYPPNQRASTTIPFPFVACSHAGPIYLHVEPVEHRGATG